MLLLGSLPALAQRNIGGELYDYSTTDQSKQAYRLSYNHIYVKFQDNTTDQEIKDLLFDAAGLKLEVGTYTMNKERNPRGFVKASLVGSTINSPEKLKAALTTLEQSSKVIVANPYIVWKNASNKNETEAAMGITEEFYVKLKPNTSVEEFRALVAVTNTTIKTQYPYNAATYILIADKNAQGNALEMANRFYESTKFEYAAVDFELQPSFGDYKVTPLPETKNDIKSIKDIKDVLGVQATVNDPLWPWQYSHKVEGPIPGGAYPVNEARAAFPGNPAPRPSDQPWNMEASMLVDKAWDIATTAGQGIKVAVIDNGVDRGHPDLAANMSPTGFDPANPANLGDAGTVAGDHGTTCAGVIAAVANNNIGVAGVAHRATIVPVQIFTAGNAGVATAIDWSWNQGGCDVLSNSWGFTGQPLGFTVPIIADAFNRALTQGRGGKGCVVLASTGNGGGNYASFPGGLPGIIGVIASNAGSTKAGFSQFGQLSDIAAPGNQIMTTDRRDTGATGGGQGYTSGSYCIIDGTSFSCPNAAAVAALILGVDNTLTNLEVRALLEGTAKKVEGGAPYTCNADQPNGSWGAQLGYGIVNAYEAVLQTSKTNNFCSTVTYTDRIGNFEDGSFGRNYENNKNCSYIIAANNASRVTLNFTSFQLGAGDRLEVYANAAGTGTPAFTYTSTASPALGTPIVVNGAVAHLRLISDATAQGQGFRLCY